MFCFQCEQTAKGKGCTKIGVCGKQPDVAALQDLLIYATKGLSQVAVEGHKVGINDRDVNVFTCEAVFSTLTNVDFDPNRFVDLLRRCVKMRDELKEKVKAAGGNTDFPEGPATFELGGNKEEMVRQGEMHGVLSNGELDEDRRSLRETIVYGLKGVCA